MVHFVFDCHDFQQGLMLRPIKYFITDEIQKQNRVIKR